MRLKSEDSRFNFPSLLIGIVACILSTGLFAQGSSKLEFTRYGIENGLQNISMTVLGQDSAGFVWLSNPLTRFDGYTFKTYLMDQQNESLGFITAESMTDDGQGNLFFASTNGVYYYDPSRDYVILIPSRPLNNPSRKIIADRPGVFWDVNLSELTRITVPGFDTLTYNTKDYMRYGSGYLRVVSGHKDLWNYTREDGVMRMTLADQKIYYYKSSAFGKYETHKFICDSNGNLWFYCDHKFWMYDEVKDDFLLKYDFQEAIQKDIFTSVPNYFLPGQNCWWFIWRNSDPIYRLNLEDDSLESYALPEKSSITSNILLLDSYVELENGTLVIGSQNAGILTIHPTAHTVHHYIADPDNPKSLRTNYTLPQLVTGGNTIWISGGGQGIVKAEVVSPIFQKYQPDAALVEMTYSSNIRSLLKWKEFLIVGGIQDVSLLREDKTFIPLPMPNNERSFNPHTGVAAMASDKLDNLLLLLWTQVEQNSLFYLDYRNNKVVNLSQYLPQLSVDASHCVYFDSQGYFWIAAQRGVIRIDSDVLSSGQFSGDTSQYKFISFESLHDIAVDVHETFSMTEDHDHQMWIGTNTGLVRIDINTEAMTFYTSRNGDKTSLSFNNVRSVFVSRDNNLWVGTFGGGLNLFVPQEDAFIRYSIQSGLPDNVIYTIAEDRQGALWLGTNKGLCRFDPKTKLSRTFVPSDGIQSYEFNTNAVCTMDDGRLAFGGIDGFNLFSPDSIYSDSSYPNISISGFKVHGRDHPYNDKIISLAHHENFLSFEFSTLDYFKTEQNQYAYKMIGIDSGWVYSNERHYTSYANLGPGHYTFQVKAANSKGVWNEIGISKSIHIQAPWWGAWWFRLLVLSVVGALVYFFYNYRLRQMIKFQKMRDQIAADLHDDIGSTLSSISIAGSVIRNKLGDQSSEVGTLVDQISTNTNNMMEAMSDIVWAVNTRHDHFEDVSHRMRAFAIELLEPLDIYCDFNIHNDVKDLRLDMTQRKNLYLIFKEAIHNAAKHSSCRQVMVDIVYQKGLIHLTIKDDGIGFMSDKNEEDITEIIKRPSKPINFGGNGMGNMQKRALEIGGEVIIRSVLHQGTTISLKFAV